MQRPMPPTPLGHLLFVFHTHLPWVLGHGRWPHGEAWLHEATAECYLPLLRLLDRLEKEGRKGSITIGLTPVLAEMLASPRFRAGFLAYLEERRNRAEADRAEFEEAGDQGRRSGAAAWSDFYRRAKADFVDTYGQGVLAAFTRLQDQGRIEIIVSAATHGYLPLLGRDESINAQIATGIASYRRHFGRAPRGIWLPECAYRPRYEWTPPTGRERGRVRWVRPGIEEMLAAHGLEFFVADAHLVSAGRPMFLYRDFMPFKAAQDEPASSVPGTEARSPYAPYRVASRGGTGTTVAFIRDPKTTLQVWSRERGYPGEYAHLEFHKKHFPGGLRFWRITDNSGDLGRKVAYDPALAVQKVGLQARHFVELVQSTLAAAAAEGPALGCSPYDAELFGHWWFEGPLWLEQIAREMARAGVTPATLGEALAGVPPRATLALPEGSWGEGGDHRVWLNRDTEWTWDRVYSAEAEWAAHLAAGRTAKGDLARVLTQATRELLLLQAS